MEDLYSQILRSVIAESEEDSAAKYQKDIDTVKKIGQFIDKNEDKFKRDFIKFFYQENGLKDSNNIDDSSQEEYQKSGALEVSWYLVDYVFKLLGQHPNEKDYKTSEYEGTYIVRITTYINLPFVSFDVQASISVTPSKSNKPGKKFVFDIDFDESTLYLWPDETQDRNFKIPDEEQIDILQYRDYDYKKNKRNATQVKELEAFKSKYVNSNTMRFIAMASHDIEKKQGEAKTKAEVKKFNETLLKAVIKHTKLVPNDNSFKTDTTWKWEVTRIHTNLGGLYVETVLYENDFSHLQKVSLYSGFEGDSKDIVLYDSEQYSKS